MIPILVTAHEHERKYIRYGYQESMGEFIKTISFHRKMNHAAVIFGSCGALDYMGRYDYLISPFAWHDEESLIVPDKIIPVGIEGYGYTADHGVCTHTEAHLIKYKKSTYTVVVDQETTKFGRICIEAEIKWQSVRYVIDGCFRRIVPPGINHFWRKHQHKRMQKKMEALLNEHTA